MKKLFIIRHAKSSWKDIKLKDFDRPLNKRGEDNLKMMSKFFSEKFQTPDLILSSPAKRAKLTAIGFANRLNYKVEAICFNENLYMASAGEIKEILSKQKDENKNLMLFGHNPGLTDFVNIYSNQYLENIPTCGIVILETEKKWNELIEKRLIIKDYFFPKMLDRI
jgi:phosphohistidine phosphatase